MEGAGKGKGKYRGDGLPDSGYSISGSSGGEGGGGNSGVGSKGNDSDGVGQSGDWLNKIEHVGWEPGEEIVINGDRVMSIGSKKMVRLVECTICKEVLVEHDTNPCVRAPCCKAIAHKSCVEEWLRRESRCFVCPHIINTRNGRAAYFANKLSADDIAAESTQEIERKIADPGDLNEEFQKAREKFLQEKQRPYDEAFGEFLAKEISGGEGVADIMSQQEKALAGIQDNLQGSLAADEAFARKLEEEEREREAAAALRAREETEIPANLQGSLAADEAFARKIEEEEREREAAVALKAREEVEKSERAARELAEMFEREAAEEEKRTAAEVTLESEGECERLEKSGERGSKIRKASPKGARLQGGRGSCSSGENNAVKRAERMAQGHGASPSNRARGSVGDASGRAVKSKGVGSRQSDQRDGREGSSNSDDWLAGEHGRGGGRLKSVGGRPASSKHSENDSDFDEKEEENEKVVDEWVEAKETRGRSPYSSKKRRLSNSGGRSNTNTYTSVSFRSNRTSPGGKVGGAVNDVTSGARQRGAEADAEVRAGADAGAGTGGRGKNELLPAASSQRRAAWHPNPTPRAGLAKSEGGEDGVDGEYHWPVSLDHAMDDAAPVDAKDPLRDSLRRATNNARVVRAGADAEGALAASRQLQASDARRQGRVGKAATAGSPRMKAAAPTAAGVPSSGFRGGGGRDSFSAAIRGGRSPRGGTSAKRPSPAKRSMHVAIKGDAHKNAIDLSQAD